MEKNDSSLSTPIKSNSVLEMVMDRIKYALINKELKPGDYLPSETELVNNLGVGKTSVREAIKMLQALGIVEVRQGHGTIIRKSTEKETINPLVFHLITQQGTNKDIVDLRGMFEPAYTMMAMHSATAEDVNNIKLTIDNLENKAKQGIQDVEDDMSFHRTILASTHNPFVIKIGETILQLFEASMQKSVKAIPERALHDHKVIFEAFCSGDEVKLQKAVFESFDGWKSIFLNEQKEKN